MKQKTEERFKAIKLRKQGWSVAEIAAELAVAKSSVSVWVRNTSLSQAAEKKLLGKITAGQLAGGRSRHKQVQDIEKRHHTEASKTISSLVVTKEHKRLMCALLYWCEGAKSANAVAFTNSEPKLIKLFLRLFREGYEIDESKFRVCVHLHAYHNKEDQTNFWSQITNIPKEQFFKPHQKVHTSAQTHEDYQGCISVRYYHADIARQLLETAKASFAVLQ